MTVVDIEPTAYLSEPVHEEQELDYEADFQDLVARFLATPTAPRDWKETLDWASGQITDRDRNWLGLCQMFCRTAPGCPGGFGTAYLQWLGCPDAAKHPFTKDNTIHDVPFGGMIFSKGDNPAGHVFIAARPFPTGTTAGISTDALRAGWPDRISRQGLMDAWGHTPLGWTENMNGYWIDVKDPKPVQTHPYDALALAAENLEQTLKNYRSARDKAKANSDWKDVEILNAEIIRVRERKARAEELYRTLRRP